MEARDTTRKNPSARGPKKVTVGTPAPTGCNDLSLGHQPSPPAVALFIAGTFFQNKKNGCAVVAREPWSWVAGGGRRIMEDVAGAGAWRRWL
jgi:hypothetical protein